MASKTFTGQLKSPTGQPLGNAQIVFHAVRTSATVPEGASASATTSASGSYSIVVEHGRYDVLVKPARSRDYTRISRNVTVDAASPSNLNALAMEYADADPDTLVEMRALNNSVRLNKDLSVTAREASEAAAQQANQNNAHTAEAIGSAQTYIDGRIAYVDNRVGVVNNQVALLLEQTGRRAEEVELHLQMSMAYVGVMSAIEERIRLGQTETLETVNATLHAMELVEERIRLMTEDL